MGKFVGLLLMGFIYYFMVYYGFIMFYYMTIYVFLNVLLWENTEILVQFH